MNPNSKKASPQVEISISCRNLVNRDTFSKSDPICILYTKMMAHEKFYEYGRTEVIYDNLNPNFVKKFMLDYRFEESQHLRFELFDIDNDTKELGEQDFLGRVDCTLGGVLAAPGGKLDKPLTGMGGEAGRIIVRAEEIGSCKELLTMQFRCKNVDRKDLIGKSDPFLVISRSNNDSTYTVVHKTEVVKNTLNATWEPFGIRSTALCNGQDEREIKLEVFDWDLDGGHDFIGECTSTLRQLRKRAGIENTYPLMNAKKTKKRGYKNSGTLILVKFLAERDYSFLDYVQGGMELNFTVAIDFTVSNGNPNELSSLHFRNPAEPNMYARALKAVGEIIQDYDTDKMFPALGFGAKVPPDQKISHEFFLNLHATNPFCEGVDGILEAYYRALDRVELYGPTNFSPVIKHVGKFAQKFQDGTHYFVLLILTDGVITDMDLTKAAVIAASSLPISIIIVGIGDADFTSMDELDSDEKKLKSVDGSRTAERDIVQFVPFRDFIDRHGNANVSQVFLAKEVLAEVPDQVLSFMDKKKIKPSMLKGRARQALAPKVKNPESNTTSSYSQSRSSREPPRQLDAGYLGQSHSQPSVSPRPPRKHHDRNQDDYDDPRNQPRSRNGRDSDYSDGRSSKRHQDTHGERDRRSHQSRDDYSKDSRDNYSRSEQKDRRRSDDHREGRRSHGGSSRHESEGGGRHEKYSDSEEPTLPRSPLDIKPIDIRTLEKIDTLPDHYYEEISQSAAAAGIHPKSKEDLLDLMEDDSYLDKDRSGESDKYNGHHERKREDDSKTEKRRHRDDDRQHHRSERSRGYDDERSDEDNGSYDRDKDRRQRNGKDGDRHRSDRGDRSSKSSDSSSRGHSRSSGHSSRSGDNDSKDSRYHSRGKDHRERRHEDGAKPSSRHHERSSHDDNDRHQKRSSRHESTSDSSRRDSRSSRSHNSGESRSRGHDRH